MNDRAPASPDVVEENDPNPKCPAIAPDEAILDGREPSGLSLAKLTQTLPVLWHEQRELFGFPPV